MDQKEIYDYVKQALNEGKSANYIKGVLISEGKGHASDVDQAIARIKEETGIKSHTPRTYRNFAPGQSMAPLFKIYPAKKKNKARKMVSLVIFLCLLCGTAYAARENGYLALSLKSPYINISTNPEGQIVGSFDKLLASKQFSYNSKLVFKVPDSVKKDIRKTAGENFLVADAYTIKLSGYYDSEGLGKFKSSVAVDPDEIISFDIIKTDRLYGKIKNYPKDFDKFFNTINIRNVWLDLGANVTEAYTPEVSSIITLNEEPKTDQHGSNIFSSLNIFSDSQSFIKNIKYIGKDSKNNQKADHYEFGLNYNGIQNYLSTTKSNNKILEDLSIIQNNLHDTVINIWISEETNQIITIELTANIRTIDEATKQDIFVPFTMYADLNDQNVKKDVATPKNIQSLDKLLKKQTNKK